MCLAALTRVNLEVIKLPSRPGIWIPPQNPLPPHTCPAGQGEEEEEEEETFTRSVCTADAGEVEREGSGRRGKGLAVITPDSFLPKGNSLSTR